MGTITFIKDNDMFSFKVGDTKRVDDHGFIEMATPIGEYDQLLMKVDARALAGRGYITSGHKILSQPNREKTRILKIIDLRAVLIGSILGRIYTAIGDRDRAEVVIGVFQVVIILAITYFYKLKDERVK